MSIKLKDTIYDLINNADKLDGSHLTDIIRYYAPSSSNVLNLDDLKSTTGFQVTGWAYVGSPYVNSQPDGDGASSAATVIKFPGNYPFQIYRFYSNNDIKVRGYYSGTGWTSWATILTSDNYTTYCAQASHSHNYASTVKVGSASYSCSSNVISLPAYPTIPTALKCPKSLTIQLNGTSQGAWDGSADKTINITPASIGASPAHSHPYLPIAGGGNLTGSAYISFNSASANSTELTNNTPFGITYGRIQSYGPMNIAADTDGSTSEHLVLTAGYSIDNAVASNGLAIGYNTLKWKGVDISLSNHTHSYSDGYVMTHHIIDTSELDQDTYYPVTIPIGSSPNVRIEIIVSLNSGSVPLWSTHSSGFSVRKIWEVNGSGWGTNTVTRRILVSNYSFASSDPVRGIGDLGYSSTEYVFVRGGGKYFFKISHGIIPTLRTSEYIGTSGDYYQSIAPTTIAPAVIGRNIAYTSDIPSSLKCPASLTIQLNGASQGAWDGSSAKTINITPASIGASPAHSHPYLPLSGGTLTGSVTFANGTWNTVGDDVAIGDYNAAGMLGLKSCNNNIPGIGFHNSAGTLLGSLTCNAGTLKWGGTDISLSGHTHDYAASSHTHTTIVGNYTANGGQQNPNYFGKNRVGALMMNTTVNGNTHYKDWLFMDCYSSNDVGGAVAIGVNRQALGVYIMRSAAARTSWAESAELLGTHNWSTYCAAKSHTHTKSQITDFAHTHSQYYDSETSRTANTVLAAPNGSAGSATFRKLVAADIPTLAISKISGLQSALDGKSAIHTHPYAGSSTQGGAATSANKLNTNAGGSFRPVYFSGGIPVAGCRFEVLQVRCQSSSNYGCSHYMGESCVSISKVTYHSKGRLQVSTDTTYTTAMIWGVAQRMESTVGATGFITVDTTYSNWEVMFSDDESTNWGTGWIYVIKFY